MILLITPPLPFTFQYTNYEYGNLDDYTEGELTTDALPTEQVNTEVTPQSTPTPSHPFCLTCMLLDNFI